MENRPVDPKLTPMMKQYLEIKKKYPREILFFRLGDFYEMFFEDAHTASKILDIALTSRQNDIPMCGIPYHAAESYIARLIKADCRVAICEQLESVPTSGTVVRRAVTRVITPGTLIESNLLQGDEHNFLASVVIAREEIGLAFVDISTGDFYLSSIEKSYDRFRGEFARYGPREVVLKESGEADDEKFTGFIRSSSIPVSRINEWLYDREYLTGTIKDIYGVAGIKGLGMEREIEILAAGSILEYLRDTQKRAIDHLKHPRRIVSADYMVLDDATIGNLELVKNQQDGSKNRTLYSVLNHARTAVGRRLLERNILQPLLDQDRIERRLDMVQYFFEYQELTGSLQSALDGMFDVERLLSRFNMGRANPRDFLALSHSIAAAGRCKGLLAEQPHDLCSGLAGAIPDCAALSERIARTIDEEPALTPEQGRVTRKGLDAELDRLYDLKKDARAWMLHYQEEEKQKLGIPTLRVKYNRVLGYYMEVSKGQAGKVPAEYFRKQTLVGGERYTTETLQKFESDILHASERIVEMETRIIEDLRLEVAGSKSQIQAMGAAIGEVDYHCSLAAAARENRFTRPRFNGTGAMHVKDGRHPVVEKYYTGEVFIPNDVKVDGDEHLIAIITGPNMSGKSTYIRMAAIIQLMAQIGSFVPAAVAEIPIVDRIFTRIGASDNISRGESTFLVEMNETAVILNNATEKSLIIMDEVGRGTSTYDGLSIAWAVVEYILRYIKAKTLFATHYHELTGLGEKRGIVNYNVLVREHLGGVDFLHKVAAGAADKSYGIHVAKLAGIPREITLRASKILERMEKVSRGGPRRQPDEDGDMEQLEMFNASNHRVIQAIQGINVESITPLEAMNELNRLKKMIE